jgi:hypothetical protein
MRIFMFKSDGKGELCAFAGDAEGSKLPQQHGPWHATGVIRPDKERRRSRATFLWKAPGSAGRFLFRRALAFTHRQSAGEVRSPCIE